MELTNPELASLLDMGRNMRGEPLSAAVRARIRALLGDPCDATWGNANGIILFRDTTLWQAVTLVDPTFPRQGKAVDKAGNVVRPWPRIPSKELVMRAIRFAVH